jgi:hypothetical protein
VTRRRCSTFSPQTIYKRHIYQNLKRHTVCRVCLPSMTSAVTTSWPLPPPPSSVIILIPHPLRPYYPTLTLRFHNAFLPLQVALHFVSPSSIRNTYETNLTELLSYPIHRRGSISIDRCCHSEALVILAILISTRFCLPSRQPKDGAFLLGHGNLGDGGSRKYFTNERVDDAGPSKTCFGCVTCASIISCLYILLGGTEPGLPVPVPN